MVSCLIYLSFRAWAALANQQSEKEQGVVNRVMLGAFIVTQIAIIYGMVQLVLVFDLPPASSITILMEMVGAYACELCLEFHISELFFFR